MVAILIAVATFPCIANADIGTDEDELYLGSVFSREFKRFHKKYGRYPKTWKELIFEATCTGSYPPQRNYLPKQHEAIVWKPIGCTLSYKIQFADQRSFRVVALAKGHVVSINDTFRVTYLKTPYHDHAPYECFPAGAVC